MGEELGGNEANSAGSGSQSVNVVISHGAGFWLAVALLAIVGLLIFTNHTASKAALQADDAKKASDNLATEYRLAQFWMTRAQVACENNGVKMPPIPASLK